ncbi:MAG: hypothetical protein U7126_00885 [Microcoleus sp.]|jgi:hypothetical protein
MTGQKFDRILLIAGFLIALIAAIPQVYNFEKPGFFWQTDVSSRQIQQQPNIQSNPNAGL